MRRGNLILSVAVCGTIACETPTEPDRESIEPPIALSEVGAIGFDEALRDVSVRVLPALHAADPSASLASATDALIAAIASRDRRALRHAIQRADAAILSLERSDSAGSLASDLDAMRLILWQAAPLLDLTPLPQ